MDRLTVLFNHDKEYPNTNFRSDLFIHEQLFKCGIPIFQIQPIKVQNLDQIPTDSDDESVSLTVPAEDPVGTHEGDSK